MRRVHLNRRLVLEAEQRVSDGAGGYTVVPQTVGSVWAMVEAGAGRESVALDRRVSKVPMTITVRAAPVGSSERPVAGQHFREGGRRYRVLAVAERDRRGLYLSCQAEEVDA